MLHTIDRVSPNRSSAGFDHYAHARIDTSYPSFRSMW
jgi:hypothetical protein